MFTGKGLLEAGFIFEGQAYSTQNPQRLQPQSNVKDCSGFAWAAHLVYTGQGFPGGGTVTMTQEQGAIRVGGRYVSEEFARWNPGIACFVRGWGPEGHVEYSVGDGKQTYGTPSDRFDPKNRDVGYSPFGANPWDVYVCLNTIHYGDEAPAVEVKPATLIAPRKGRKKMVSVMAADGAHFYMVPQEGPMAGALVEEVGLPGKLQRYVLLEPNSCKTGPECSLDIVDVYAVAGSDAGGFIVSALAANGRRAHKLWWKAGLDGKFLGWQHDLGYPNDSEKA